MNPLKIVVLKDHSHLMGELIELDEEPMYLIQNCYKITDGEFSAYPLYTDQRDIFLTSDVILTIVDPSDETTTNYKKSL
jgi:hypothetical protein